MGGRYRCTACSCSFCRFFFHIGNRIPLYCSYILHGRDYYISMTGLLHGHDCLMVVVHRYMGNIAMQHTLTQQLTQPLAQASAQVPDQQLILPPNLAGANSSSREYKDTYLGRSCHLYTIKLLKLAQKPKSNDISAGVMGLTVECTVTCCLSVSWRHLHFCAACCLKLLQSRHKRTICQSAQLGWGREVRMGFGAGGVASAEWERAEWERQT